MVSSDVFSHGTNFAGRISAAGYVWRSAGENIATGFQTPRSVVNAWMASTGHCQNILNPTYGNVGTGVSRAPVRGWAYAAPAPGPRTSRCRCQVSAVGQLRPDGRLPLLKTVVYAEACAAALASLTTSAPGNGVSRRYHSASSAAWQPEPAAVTAWR